MRELATTNTNRVYGRPAQAWIGGQPRPVWVVAQLCSGATWSHTIQAAPSAPTWWMAETCPRFGSRPALSCRGGRRSGHEVKRG
jgi:hypothetical protein